MRILAANPDTLGDLILRQPLYAALLADGHELMLTVRQAWMDLAPSIAPGAQLAAFSDEPYTLGLNPQWEAYAPLLATAREFKPDVLLIAPYRWTLLEEWLAENLPGLRVLGMEGRLFAGDPRWGQHRESRLKFDAQVQVPESALEVVKNQALASLILGRQVALPDPALTAPEDSIALAQVELARRGLAAGEYWVGCVGHSPEKAVRNWTLQNWSAVLHHWATTHHRRFLLLGSEEERETTAAVRLGIDGWAAESVASACGDLPLGVMAGLIHLSRGYVGRDTGPMHLAGAMGKPVIAVFGGGTWPRFQPAATPSWIAMVKVPCVGCDWLCPFDQSYCIKEVPVADVRAAIDDMEAGRLTGRVVHALKPRRQVYAKMVRQTPPNRMAELGTYAAYNRGELQNQQDVLRSQQNSWAADREELLARHAATVAAMAETAAETAATLHGQQEESTARIDELSRQVADLAAQLKAGEEKLNHELAQSAPRNAQLQALKKELHETQLRLLGSQADAWSHRQTIARLKSSRVTQTEALADARQRLARARPLFSRLAEQRQADRRADDALIQSLVAANRELDARVRLLMTSRLMRAGWKFGLGKLPQWPDLRITPEDANRRGASQDATLAELDELVALPVTEDAPAPLSSPPAPLVPAPIAIPPARNRRPWPYAAPDDVPLPPTLPGGKPWPRITVVTPSFNQGQYIEQTILSVLNQDYPNLQYIIMDGLSTDATMSVIDRYRDRISHVTSEKDKGQSNAINKGFALATGELLTWLNSDDMLEPGALAGMAMAFHTSGADMVAGVCTLHDNGKVLGQHTTSCTDGPLPLDDLLDLDACWQKGQFFYQPEVMFTRALWQRAGGFVDESLYFSMDYDLWVRFAEQGARLHVIGRPICLFRVHEQQKTRGDFLPELTAVRDRHAEHHSGILRERRGSFDKTSLRVVFFNDLGGIVGAGIAHLRLAKAVSLAGHQVIPLAIASNLVESRLSSDDILSAIAERHPDMVILGNLHAARLDPALPGLIARRWPTVQVMHDLHGLTGRCAYPGDCTMHLSGCDHTCPTAHEYPVLDPRRIHDAWQTKQAGWTGDDAAILGGVSAWGQQFAREHFEQAPAGLVHLGRAPRIVGIRHGLPLEIFQRRDKSLSRDLLGLPQDRFIILFSASHLGDKRKGLDHLFAALDICRLPNLLAVCVGHFEASPELNICEIRGMGYISDPQRLALLYSAVDLFVGPSLVETFGQVFIEAAACGTPSVGYATAGGVADAVADGLSGRLAPRADPAELAAAISQLHGDPALRRHMAAWGRLWVENERSYRSTCQNLFAQLNHLGVTRKLGLPPKVAFFPESTSDPAVTYLEPGDQPLPMTPLPAAREAESLMPLQSRLAALEAERDSLRAAMNSMTQTRLWRLIAATYPIYQRLLYKSYLPRFVRRSIQGSADWLAARPRHPTEQPANAAVAETLRDS